MTTRSLTWLVIIILIVVGIVWAVANRNRVENRAGSMTNEQMLRKENGTTILVYPDVEYFEGASGYFVRPEVSGNYPGVVMIHENRGLRQEIRDTAEALAKEGYYVLAVDLFNGRVVETQEEARQLTSAYDQEAGIENLRAAAQYLRGQGASRVASLGWCFGGGQSLQLALSGETLDATVMYYGQVSTSTAALSRIKWPVLGIFAGTDQVIPVANVNQFDSALDSLGIQNEIYIYPNVGHAFANPSGMNYAPEQTMDAWNKTLSFLSRHLKQTR